MIIPSSVTKQPRWLPIAAICLFGTLGALWLTVRPVAWMLLRQGLHRKFPEVSRVSTAELAAWLHDGRRPPPVLLDVRSASEYEVSHLAGARWIDPKGDATAQMGGIAKDAPIVVYCSVGYRSSEFAEKLQRVGFKDVHNLEGSLFQWANEGRPLADGKRRIHPYNFYWGLLLNSGARDDKADASLR